jgi:hypothetical protein
MPNKRKSPPSRWQSRAQAGEGMPPNRKAPPLNRKRRQLHAGNILLRALVGADSYAGPVGDGLGVGP